jgi:hypothetical protein
MQALRVCLASALACVSAASGAPVETKLLASDGAAGDRFGISVAIDGDSAVVGAWEIGSSEGAAYVLDHESGGWTEKETLTASDAAPGDHFGRGVAIQGGTFVVGSPDHGFGGAAYVYTRGSGGFGEQKLVASDPSSAAQFGASVAIDGDTLVVGAFAKDDERGAAYVFRNDGGTWVEEQKLLASDGEAGDSFGWAIDVEGDTAVVGALYHVVGAVESGTAYVFTRAGTVWSEQPQLSTSGVGTQAEFGRSVAIDADRIVVGAARDAGTGAAYEFVSDGVTPFATRYRHEASDGAGIDNFGISVALAGDVLVVGAYNDDVEDGMTNIQDAGSIYVFDLAQGLTNESVKISASDPGEDDRLGFSVGVSGQRAIAGADLDDENGADSGAAYVFEPILGPPPSLCPTTLEPCPAAAKGSLSVVEKKLGGEKLTAKLQAFEAATGPADFGDPVAAATRYDVCIYHPAGTLSGGLTVDRAGALCGKKQKPCWKAAGTKGWSYKDPDASAAGVRQLKAIGGPVGKGKVQIKAGNAAKKGQLAMPTGIAAALQGAASATLQLRTSDAACFQSTLGTVKKADGVQFKARAP